MLLLVNVHGNSATADKLKTAKNIKLQGAVSGNANFDGNNDVTITTTQSNIAVIMGTMNADKSTSVTNSTAYPAGFTKDNCIVIASMLQSSSNSNGVWGMGTTFDSSSLNTGNLAHRVYLNANGVVILAKLITMTNNTAPQFIEFTGNINYKIVLMKVS